MPLSIEDQLQRQKNINIHLMRKLEQCRKDTVEYCAKFCEDHAVTTGIFGVSMQKAKFPSDGHHYAKALRGIIGK